jgi:isochorismate pyruvate lyase
VPADSFTSLAEVRAAIDALDAVLVTLLKERCACIVAAARLKSSPNEAFVLWRVEDVVQKVRAQAESIGFSPDRAEAIWRGMMTECIAFEHDVLSERGQP